MRNPKAEGRDPKEIRRPKAETSFILARHSDFEFRPSFGFRISAFGFPL